MDNEASGLGSTRGESVLETAVIALNLVPGFGGAISSAVGFFLGKRKDKRLQDFVVSLANDIQAVQGQINPELSDPKKFADFLAELLSQASETRQQEKLDALRAVFLNVLLSDHPDYDEALEIVEMFSRWQARHVIMLKILSDPVSADKGMGGPVGNGGGIATSLISILSRLLPKWNSDQIDRTWQDLEASQIHRTPGTRTMISDRGIHQLENRLTEFGQKVAIFLTNPVQN